MIDTATNSVTSTISLADWGEPGGLWIALTPDGTRAYVTMPAVNAVKVIDTAINAVSTTIHVNRGPEGVAITPDGTRAYVANRRYDTVSVIDTASNAVLTTIPVGKNPEGVAIMSR